MSALRPSMWIVDPLLAVVFAASCAVELHYRVEDGPFRGPLWWNVAINLAFCAPLVVRRSHPRACLTALMSIYLLPRLVAPHASLFFGNFVPFLLVIYTVARYAQARWARWAWLGGVVFWIGLLAQSGPDLHLVANPVLPVVGGLIAWLAGRVLARLAVQRAQLAEALRCVGEEQSAQRELAVAAERARIAAEMHDVVANALSLMVVQIGDARLGLERDGRCRVGLLEAERTGREALVELRRSLGVLRVATTDEDRLG